LETPLLANVVGDGQKDGDILLVRVLARIEAPDDAVAAALVDVAGSGIEPLLECRRKREVFARQVVEADFARCPRVDVSTTAEALEERAATDR